MATPAKSLSATQSMAAATAARPSPIRLSAHVKTALALMLEAYVTTPQQPEHRSWESAVTMPELRDLDASESDLRWLIGRGLVEYAVEVTQAGDVTRGFRQPPRPTFDDDARFKLTPAGATVAYEFVQPGMPTARRERAAIAGAESTERMGPVPSAPLVPKWDRNRNELKVGSIVVMRFKLRAGDQEAILAAFEENAWPERMVNPLAARGEPSDCRQLQAAVEALNGRLARPLVRFWADGQEIFWNFSDPGK
jgi:hypothetical protein